jgi:DNA-binding NarL/FixJ family response regulator
MDVFVVEDSAVMRQRLLVALEAVPGTRVVGWADSAEEAIAGIERLRPHLVVLDLRLAHGTGLTVLEAIKRLMPAPTVAVLTNYPQMQYRRRCDELGADFFLDKAAGFDPLLEVCRAVGAGGDVTTAKTPHGR